MLQASRKFAWSIWNPYWQIWLICNIIWENATLKLSWKFCESKWYPYWVIVLTSSSGTSYVPNEHESVDQCGSFSIPYEFVLYQSHPEPKWNPYWVIVLTSSSGTNYVPNEHEGVDQYGSFSIPSESVLYQSHTESLVNQNEILIELLC